MMRSSRRRRSRKRTGREMELRMKTRRRPVAAKQLRKQRGPGAGGMRRTRLWRTVKRGIAASTGATGTKER
eukprot:42814-Eustigmatos_ZCMA.PRE.1